MSERQPEAPDERVLVLAPTARDGAASCALLAAAGVRAVACATIAEVCREVGRGAGAAVVTAEAVLGDAEGRLTAALRAQPAWADLPLIVLTPPGPDVPKVLRALEAVGPMTLMKRPVHVSTLVSAVRTALRDRRRQYAVRDLLAERERHRVTLASIGDAVIATDTAGRVTFLNDVARALTGWAEAAGRPLVEVFAVVDEHTRRPAENPALRALREGAAVALDGDTVLIARDGSERPIDDSAAPIRDAAGAPVGAVLVFRDVTARRQAEERLRASERRYRTLVTAIDQGFCVIEVQFADGRATDYRFLEANPVFEHQTGLADPVGRTIRELAPDIEERWFEIYGRVVATGEATRFVEGSAALGRWFDVFASRVGGPGSRTVAILFSDVTERRRAEAERERLLREIETERGRLADVFQHAPSFMCVLRGPDHVFERVNERYSALVSGRRLIGRPLRDALPEVAGQGFVELLDRVYRTGEAFVGAGARVVLEPGGGRPPEERFLDFVYQPLRDADGRVTGILVQGVDLTDRKRAEDALKEADRKKDDFIALLAHELRNPLAPIRNGLQTLRLSPEPATRERSQAIMDRQLAHMVRMIDDLLDVSRIGRNKMTLRRARVTLAEVVGSAVETARPVIEEAGHELTVTLPPRPVLLDADLTRLAQVFANLLTNSAKYTERGGAIRLTADAADGAVSVAVRDTGIGIPADALPTLFEMFSQVEHSIERSKGGLGIGLALVKGLVEMHRGTVSAASAGAGRGSTFTVTLPALPADAAEPDRAVPDGPAAGPGRRLLVVDDNRDGAESLAAVLQLMGNEVATAHDGVEAVERAEAFRPEVILMDIGMPRLNGLEATARIRARPWGTMTIVALTGWGQDADRERSRAAGCDGHLVKPVSASDLEALLAELSRPKPA